MRKAILMVPALLLLLFCGAPCSAKGKTYTFGFYTGQVSTLDAQFKTTFSDVMKVLAKKINLNFNIVNFSTTLALEKAMKTGGTDILLSADKTYFYRAVKKNGYTPFMTFSLFGRKTNKLCVYTKKGKAPKKIADLKGMKLTMSRDEVYYYFFRKLIGEKPDVYFRLQGARDSTAAIYALALDEADAMFVMDVAVEYAKLGNPGLVKSIQEIACTPPMLENPVLAAKNVPPMVPAALLDVVLHFDRYEELRKYQPLLKKMKMKYFPATLKDYSAEIEMIDSALKNGWNKDFANWMKKAGKP